MPIAFMAGTFEAGPQARAEDITLTQRPELVDGVEASGSSCRGAWQCSRLALENFPRASGMPVTEPFHWMSGSARWSDMHVCTAIDPARTPT